MCAVLCSDERASIRHIMADRPFNIYILNMTDRCQPLFNKMKIINEIGF
jgi:hypothetical protein